VLEQMQRIQVDINSEVGQLSTPNPEIGTGGAPSPPRSSLDSF
jgi:hypothetical protein